MHLDSVLCASLVGVMAHTLSPRYAPIAFGAAFAGMSTTTVVPEAYWTLLLGTFNFIIYALFDRIKLFAGYGGRLGTMAWISSVLIVPALYWLIPDYQHTFWTPARYSTLDITFCSYAMVVCVLASLITIVCRRLIEPMALPVPSAAIVALVACFVLLPINYYRTHELLIFHCIGMSVGMSSPDILPYYLEYIILGFVSGLMGFGAYGLSTGETGGKAGFIAFLAIVFYVKVVKFLWVKCASRLKCLKKGPSSSSSKDPPRSSLYDKFIAVGPQGSIPDEFSDYEDPEEADLDELDDLDDPFLSPYAVINTRASRAAQKQKEIKEQKEEKEQKQYDAFSSNYQHFNEELFEDLN